MNERERVNTDWLLSDELAPSIDDALLGELYAAAAEGTLVLPFCADCRLPLELDQQVCDVCRSTTVVWQAVEPTGIVHSSTLVHRREAGLVLAEAPYPVVDVQVSSGHRLIMTTHDPTSTPVAIGTPVTVGFRQLGTTHVPSAILTPTTPTTVEAMS